MNYDLITNIESCYVETPSLLYYSHIPTAILSLFLGFFVFLKNKYSLKSKIFLCIVSLFSLWSLSDLATWVNPQEDGSSSFLNTIFSLGVDSRFIMFFWSMVNLIEPFIFTLLFYFCFIFLQDRDLSFRNKILLYLPLIPVVLLISSKFNLTHFDNPECQSIQGGLIYYIYFLEILFSLLIVLLLVKEFFRASKENRPKVLYFSIGILSFIFAFSWTNVIGNFSTILGIDMTATESWTITQYGLFGMPVFLGFLSYLILKYQAFNVKVIATQYFIVIIWLAVSSQFFLNQERSDYPLLILSWLITTFGGFWLFRVMGKEDEMAKQLLVAQAKLSRINNKLREISQAKSEFISIASHQLRTPLTSIKGYACLILEKTFGLVPKKQKEALEKILINNEKLVLLVEDMLNVSRLEAGRLEYDFEKQPILPIVEDAISNLKLYAKNKGLSMKLVKCRDAKNLNIIADSRKIFEIISNLIDNSIKYTPKGGLIIKIEKTKHSQKIGRSNKADTKVTDWIKISVADTGIGIDKKDLETIFEKYQQGGSLIGNSTPASTGLGIYIGRQMAKAHGGKLYAKSEGKNKGSTFVLCLPLAQENGEK